MNEQLKNLNSLLKPIESLPEAIEIINKHTPSPLYITVFKQASMFNSSFLMLSTSMLKNKKLDLIAPMIMNLSFSTELCLKAFILFEKKDVFRFIELNEQGFKINGHKYSELFVKIKDEHRKAILKELSIKLNIPVLNDSDFKKILLNQKCDNSFVEWRYIFEQNEIGNLNVELLIILNESLGKILLELIKKEEL